MNQPVQPTPNPEDWDDASRGARQTALSREGRLPAVPAAARQAGARRDDVSAAEPSSRKGTKTSDDDWDIEEVEEEETVEETTEEPGDNEKTPWTMDRPLIYIVTILALGVIVYLIARFTGINLQ